MNKIRRNIYKLFPLAMLGLYLHQNKFVSKREFNIVDKKIPKSFNNYTIIQLSDIHCDKVGISDSLFLQKIKKENPDIIVITGDLLDSYNNNKELAYNLLSQFCSIAKCYFISGNHEIRLKDDYNELKCFLDKVGIVNLSNKNEFLEISGSKINLVGVEDFEYFNGDYENNNSYFLYRKMLKSLYKEDYFNILLAHRPEKFSIYESLNYDLILSGHAHGGQWNLPFFGRIFAPSQGFFPKYTNGIYKKDNSKMLVSQGLGNSSFPLRINNKLEIVVINLKNI